MTKLNRFLALLLLAVWLPMTSHCYLEESGLLDIAILDECCAQEDHTTSAPITSDPCDTGCKMVEKTGYKFQDDHKLIVPAVIVLLTFALPLCSSNNFSSSSEVTKWPPDTFHLAQFVARTALPVRAPTFVS